MITVNIFLQSRRHEWFEPKTLSDILKWALGEMDFHDKNMKKLEAIKPHQKVVSRYVLDRGENL